MRLKFIKLGGYWFYWDPFYEGDPSDLIMVNGSDTLLNTLGTKYVEIELVDIIGSPYSDFTLVIDDVKEEGAYYQCLSKLYKGPAYLCPVTLGVLGEYPREIYGKVIKHE